MSNRPPRPRSTTECLSKPVLVTSEPLSGLWPGFSWLPAVYVVMAFRTCRDKFSEQEHCSLSLKSGRAEVCGSFDIKSRAVVRWNKFRQIFISYHLATRECLFQLVFRRKTRSCFNSLASSDSYPLYEMKQISVDFHLISRLSGSHLNCHSYKSH